MKSLAIQVMAVLFTLNATAHATTITFSTDPFDGSAALTTPGRQVVGGEPFITFSPATDVFEFFLPAFTPYGFGPDIQFVNDVASNLPTSGVNVIVLRSFDDDANLATPFGAGNAANLIAAQLTSPDAGFFIYFNSGLNLPRLVFSTDLNDPTADLKIMARMTNLTGPAGQTTLATFTSANFSTTAVPEPASLLLLGTGIAGVAAKAKWRGRRAK